MNLCKLVYLKKKVMKKITFLLFVSFFISCSSGGSGDIITPNESYNLSGIWESSEIYRIDSYGYIDPILGTEIEVDNTEILFTSSEDRIWKVWRYDFTSSWYSWYNEELTEMYSWNYQIHGDSIRYNPGGDDYIWETFLFSNESNLTTEMTYQYETLLNDTLFFNKTFFRYKLFKSELPN